MSTLTEEIGNHVRVAQDMIERSLRDAHKQARGTASWVWIVAAGATITTLAAGAGLIAYSRRRRSLAERLQVALPDSVRDVRDELSSRLKRPLERAVKAL